MRFDLVFFCVVSKYRLPGKLHAFYDFLLEKLATVTFIEEVALACKALSIESMVGEVF